MKTSVILNTYNRDSLLDRGLYSIFNQGYPKTEYEVIVVDDSSKDNTQQVIMKYMREVDNLKYFYRDKGKDKDFYTNAAFCANIGMKQASGEIIIRCDAEIIHEKESIRKLTEVHSLEDNIICFAEMYNLPFEGRVMNNLDNFPWKNDPTCFLAHKDEMEVYTGLTIQRPLVFLASIKKKHYMELGGYEESFKVYGCEDNWFADCLIKMGIRYRYMDSRMLKKSGYSDHNILDDKYEPYCCIGFHQGHKRWKNSPHYENSFDTLKRFVDMRNKGEIGYKSNIGKDWGVVEKGFSIKKVNGRIIKATLENDKETSTTILQ